MKSLEIGHSLRSKQPYGPDLTGEFAAAICASASNINARTSQSGCALQQRVNSQAVMVKAH